MRLCFSIPLLVADLIVLAGDIDVGIEGLTWVEELTKFHKKSDIYIAGIHECDRYNYVGLT